MIVKEVEQWMHDCRESRSEYSVMCVKQRLIDCWGHEKSIYVCQEKRHKEYLTVIGVKTMNMTDCHGWRKVNVWLWKRWKGSRKWTYIVVMGIETVSDWFKYLSASLICHLFTSTRIKRDWKVYLVTNTNDVKKKNTMQATPHITSSFLEVWRSISVKQLVGP